MEPNDVLAEVNEEGKRNRLPAIRLSGEWGEGTVSRLEQAMPRLRVSPTSFHLYHIWVDLRQKTALN